MDRSEGSLGLSAEGCRQRQRRLGERLRSAGLDAALIVDPRHVHYFTGYWTRGIYATACLVEQSGGCRLLSPFLADARSAFDENSVYECNRLGTLVDDQAGAVLAEARRHLGRSMKLGTIGGLPSGSLDVASAHDILSTAIELRRSKGPDEIAFLRRIIAATEHAYRVARDLLKPGVTEIDVYASAAAAAIDFLGEGLCDFGNDFQIGAVGSAPRRRKAEAGETLILDLTVGCRGYGSDMCRTFVTGGNPTAGQQRAHLRIVDVLERAVSMVRPGVRCRDVYDEVFRMLDGFEGAAFPHHAGHGIGVGQHEAPRINPRWDDAFAIGDVFTLEPGLYAPSLHAGIRVEDIFHLSPSGLERLTSFPRDL